MCQSFVIRLAIIILTVACLLFYFAISSFSLRNETFQTPSTEKPEVNESIVEKYQEQSHSRQIFLKESIPEKGYYALYNALVPEVFCKDLIRIGGVGDGGKWICNPTNMLDFAECNIYSLGISNDPSFEEDLQSFLKNKCKVRSVDRDEQTSKTMERIEKINGKFKKALIGGEKNISENTFTFHNILSEFGDGHIDILKIDIEGGEFAIIDEIVSTPICQVLIEIHGKSAVQTFELLQKFSKNDFYLFSYEINGAFHELCEYSFIHKSCLSLFKVKLVFGKFLT